jgi:type I restriction enzyme S subunit
MAAVDETFGEIARPEIREYEQVSKGYTSFRENDILFAKITPCMENGKAAIARNLVNGVGFGSTEFHVLRPNPDVIPEWIFAYIRTPSFRAKAEANFTGTAGQRRVPTDFIKRVQIPVPPLAEQDRIVKLLDEADALRKLRAEADRRMAEVVPALFYEMFGDPVRNEKGWEVRSLGEITSIVAPLVDPRDPEYLDLPHIGPDRIESGTGKLLPAATAREDGLISVKFLFDSCDVLYSKIRPNLRKAALPNEIGLCSADMYPLRPGPLLTRHYLWSLLLTDQFTNRAVYLSARANMPKLNREQLASIRVSVPELPLQQAFSSRIGNLFEMQYKSSASIARSDSFMGSELDIFFNGR